MATVHEDVLDDVSSSGSGTGFFTALWRHKALLLFGTAVGLTIGFVYYLNKAPTYQSSAQVVVMKMRSDPLPNNGGDFARVSYVEDYVATQEARLLGQTILKAAAFKLENQPLRNPIPPAEMQGYIGSGLKVSRNKDVATGASSNVLTISFKGPSAEDCALIVTAVIDAYKQSLDGAVGSFTDEQLKRLVTNMEKVQLELTDLEKKLTSASERLQGASSVNLSDLKSRININESRKLELVSSKRDLDSRLQLIQKAINEGSDKAVLYQLFQLSSPEKIKDAGPPETPRSVDDVLFQLKVQEQELLQRLGSDHPDVIALRKRVELIKEYVKDQMARNNAVKTPVIQGDPLELYLKVLKAQQEVNDIKIKDYQESLDTDREAVRKLEQNTEVLIIHKNNYDHMLKERTNLEERKRQIEMARDARLFDAETITPAVTGTKVSPMLLTSLGVAAFIGLVLGCGLAYLAEVTDRSFRSLDEVRRRLGLTVIGQVPPLTPYEPSILTENPIDPNLVVHHAPKSVQAEAYRGVRTSLFFSTRGKGHQVIQVTSPNPGDGKSTLISNLATSIAQSGKRVILIDADFRKPRVHKIFGLGDADVGLASVIAGEAELEEAIRPCEVPGLSILPCGPRPVNPADLLTSALFQEILEEIKKNYDYVLIDTPPILAVSDPSVVAQRVDGVILTIRMTKNSRPLAEQAKERLAVLGANVIGVVVNGMDDMSKGYGYGYGYGYAYQYAYGDDAEEVPEALPAKAR
ncbi:MAG: polysaccharide biosynthesis tyrosine autokinase [Planctomycetes bacterium]|nr:polysaccharide biosynthesis tyrosine autokinase [Planctomycetota bacterium]